MKDEQAILELHEAWIAAELAGRPEDLLALCSDDVCFLVPGRGALRGRDEVRRLLVGPDATPPSAIAITGLALEIGGSIAIKQADFRTTLAGADKHPATVVSGTHAWTLRKQASDGRWRVTCVAWAVSSRSPWPGGQNTQDEPAPSD